MRRRRTCPHKFARDDANTFQCVRCGLYISQAEYDRLQETGYLYLPPDRR